ncbi:MAG: hypothetical protein RLP44_29720 [Aggregatilineales bacterium]
MNYNRAFAGTFLFFLVLAGMIESLSENVNYAQVNDCERVIDGLHDDFNFSTSQLVFMHTSSNDQPEYVVEFSPANERFYIDNGYVEDIAISPNGLSIARIQILQDALEVRAEIIIGLPEHDNQISYEIYASNNIYPLTLQWLDDAMLLLSYVSATQPPEYYYFSIFDITTGEISYVHPFATRELDSSLFPSQPLYPEGMITGHPPPRLSPNGRYIYYTVFPISTPNTNEYSRYIFDVEQGIQLPTENIPEISDVDVVWSSDSEYVYGVVSIESSQSIVQYNVGEDRVEQIFNTDLLNLSISSSQTSGIFLPTYTTPENYLAFQIMGNSQNEGVKLLDLTTNSVQNTCIKVENRAAFWSQNGRYLAIYGMLNNSIEDYSNGIYVFDTQTEDIFQIYEGEAVIVGWAQNPQ